MKRPRVATVRQYAIRTLSFPPGWRQYICPTDEEDVPRPKRLCYYHKSSHVSWREREKKVYVSTLLVPCRITPNLCPQPDRYFNGRIPSFFTSSFSMVFRATFRMTQMDGLFPEDGPSRKSPKLVGKFSTTNREASAVTRIPGRLRFARGCSATVCLPMHRRIHKTCGWTRIISNDSLL